MAIVKVGEQVKYGLFVKGEDMLGIQATLNFSNNFLNCTGWITNSDTGNPFTHVNPVIDNSNGAFNLAATIPTGEVAETEGLMLGTVTFEAVASSNTEPVKIAVNMVTWRDGENVSHEFSEVRENTETVIESTISFDIWLEVVS